LFLLKQGLFLWEKTKVLHKGGAQRVMAANYLSKSRHGTIYFFKRRVPLSVLPILNKSVLTFSLRTSNLKKARIRARSLAVQSDCLFERLRKGDVMLEKLIENEGIRFNYGFQCEFDGETRALKTVSINTDPGNQADYEAAQRAIQTIMQGFEGDPRPIAALELTDSGDKLSVAVEEYLSGIQVKPQSIRSYRTKLTHFISYFGADRGVLTLEQKDLVEYSKKAKLDIPNPTTSNQYIKTAGSFLKWIRIRAGKGPLTTSTLTQKRTTAPYKDRDSFTVAQIKVMFEHALKYRESSPAKYWATLAVAFTGARLEEISQLNIGEDLNRTEGGIWYLDLNERPDKDGVSRKSLKKLSTERVIAIHSALVDRGFTDYLKLQIKNGFTRPFESCWKPLVNDGGGDYKWSHGISKWGSKEMKSIRLAFPDLAFKKVTFFHSHRHTITTVLATKGISEEVRSAIQGQKSGGGVNGDTYSKIRLDPALSSKVLEEQLTHFVEMLEDIESTK
jgi:integrase